MLSQLLIGLQDWKTIGTPIIQRDEPLETRDLSTFDLLDPSRQVVSNRINQSSARQQHFTQTCRQPLGLACSFNWALPAGGP